MSTILFSIIIPVYNVQCYLNECINSVLIQDFNNFEVILVNDGSTDNSGKICDKFALSDSRIKVIHKKNGGLSDARNTGIKIANGDYILFLDSDDYWTDKNALNYLADICLKNDCDIIYFNYSAVYEKKIVRYPPFDLSRINGHDKKSSLTYLIESGLFIPSACFKTIKLKLLIENNLFFKKGILSEDIDWNFDVVIHARNIYATNAQFYAYRQHEGSITKSLSEKNIHDLISIIEKWAVLIPKKVSDLETQNLLLSYCAYQLAIVLGGLSYISRFKNDIFWDRIKKLKYLFKYKQNKKVKKVAILVYLFDLKVTSRILGFYLKLHREGIRIS